MNQKRWTNLHELDHYPSGSVDEDFREFTRGFYYVLRSLCRSRGDRGVACLIQHTHKYLGYNFREGLGDKPLPDSLQAKFFRNLGQFMKDNDISD
jgi:hypothetical protein